MKKRAVVFGILFLVLTMLLSGCTGGQEGNGETGEKKFMFQDIVDWKDIRIGFTEGSYTASVVPGMLQDAGKPDSEVHYSYYKSAADLSLALLQNKIDVFTTDQSFLFAMQWEGYDFTRVEEQIAKSDYGIAFPKGKNGELREELNAFIADMKDSGEADRLKAKWLAPKEPEEHPDYLSLTGEKGTLKIGITSTSSPFVYKKAHGYSGYEVEILTRFAKEKGYKLEFTDTERSGLMTGLTASTPKYDMAMAGFTITPERKESVDFSIPYMRDDVVFILKGVATEEGDFFTRLAASFEKTFVREDRWKDILSGVGVTLIISICATVLGTLQGFLLYMAYRSKLKWLSAVARGVARVYSRIVAGTPIVVILMILYYVIFGSLSISGIAVAVLGFMFTFGAFVFEHLKNTVEGVDIGQTEAARALGYSRNRAFFKIVLPQAMRAFLPVYSGEIISLIKGTSVVGYIAVNDLTKVGDIIRSNTYEAFFPLIATALIYFFMTWGLSAILQVLRRKTEPKKRKKESILKGVTVK